jgi:dolichol-phosphate mannosyltransferase
MSESRQRGNGAPDESPRRLSSVVRLPDDWEVPSAHVVDLAPRTTDLCVVIPVVDEGERLLAQLRRMAELPERLDFVIADGGSSDGSTDPATLAALGVRALLVKSGGPALSAQLRTAFAWGLGEGYEGFVTVDGNGKDGVEAVPRFAERLRAGVDFVQGSRYIEGGEEENTPLDRSLGVRLLHAPLLSLASGFRYTDTTNGFRAFSAGLLRDDRVRPFRDIFETYNLHYYLARRAARLGFRVEEIPVRRVYPDVGRTPTKISGLTARLHILSLLLHTVVGSYDPERPSG